VTDSLDPDHDTDDLSAEFATDTPWSDRDLAIVHVPVGELIPAPWNPRKITAKARAKLKKVLQDVGFLEPIVVQPETRYIIGGNTRFDIALELGYRTVPVVYRPGLSDTRAKAIAIFLNNKEAQGDWVMSGLAGLLKEIEAATDDDPDVLALAGYTGDDLTKVLGDFESDALEEVEVRPLPNMTWVLIGIPTVRFVEIAEEIERIKDLDDVFVDLVANDRQVKAS
jgi:ParB-like nuclease domain